jgi:1-deoxy-D-xylulose-5-phosphate reductoisomerase
MAAACEVCRLIVLGSTGSIGTQTLEVVGHLNTLHARGEWPTRFEVVGLAAGSNTALLAEQVRRFGVRRSAARDGDGSFSGGDGPCRLVREIECDMVVAAISGAAGLPATLAAIELGRDVALANKETLVAAGELVVRTAMRTGARLFPVDSEHSGLWQCLGSDAGNGAPPTNARVRRAVITASGGPFRGCSAADLERATPERALKHPTWSMGRKVTIDSATLMNKSLEVIEAHWLFGLDADRIGVLVHPQSLIHAMVEFADGSVLAQLGAPDMKGPIMHALCRGERRDGCGKALNWPELSRLTFEEPDAGVFPAVTLGHRAIRDRGAAGAVLNAANEVAVDAFLAGSIPFTRIAELASGAMDAVSGSSATLGEVLDADRRARDWAGARIGARR